MFILGQRIDQKSKKRMVERLGEMRKGRRGRIEKGHMLSKKEKITFHWEVRGWGGDDILELRISLSLPSHVSNLNF